MRENPLRAFVFGACLWLGSCESGESATGGAAAQTNGGADAGPLEGGAATGGAASGGAAGNGDTGGAGAGGAGSGGTSSGGTSSGGTSSGGTGGGVDCDVLSPFTELRALTELNTAALETAVRLTADERIVVFQRDTFPNATLYIAERASAAGEFGPPRRIALDGELPWISEDGLSLLRVTETNWLVAVRDSVSDEFVQSRIVNAPGRAAPFVAGEYVYYTSQTTPAIVQTSQVELAPVGAGIDHFANLPGDTRRPVVTRDGLSIYFWYAEDIQLSRRDNSAAVFPAPRAVAELNTAGDDYPGWISTDNCRLYLDQDGEIFVAQRKP